MGFNGMGTLSFLWRRVPEKMTIRDFCSRFEFLINKYFKTRRVFGIVCLKVVLLFVHEEEEHHWGTELP